MKSSMQMLCRLLDALILRGIGWLGLGLFWSIAANAAVPAQAGAVALSPRQAMEASVQQWVAQSQKLALEKVVMVPLDARLQVRPCAQPLAMDLPFASAETVRVRCQQPEWQLYVRVQLPPKIPEATKPATAEQPAAPTKRWMLVAAQPLQRGTSLQAAHVRRVEVDTSGVPVNVLEQTSELLHAELVRDVRVGAPIRRADIRAAVLVKRGQMVLLSLGQAQGFQISARVEALQDGRHGEQIKLKNRESGRELSGRVLGPNRVQGL